MSRLTLSFGAISPPIEQQLQEKGLTLGMSAPKFQRAVDSIVFLWLHSYLTKAQVDSARKKLMKEIAKEAKDLL